MAFHLPQSPSFWRTMRSCGENNEESSKTYGRKCCACSIEMVIILTQIEAIVNSRPLTPVSDDPRDLEALTQGHFLIGSSIISLPEADVQEIPINRLSRWQHVEQLRQRFWSRWSKEYLITCQQRIKSKMDDSNQLKVVNW